MKIFSTAHRTITNDILNDILTAFLSTLLSAMVIFAPIFSLFLLFLYLAVVFTMKAFSKKSPHTSNTNRSTKSCHIPQPPAHTSNTNRSTESYHTPQPPAHTSSNTHHENLQPDLEDSSLPASNLNSTGRTSRIYVNATNIDRPLGRSLTVPDQLIRYLSSCPPIVLLKKTSISFMSNIHFPEDSRPNSFTLPSFITRPQPMPTHTTISQIFSPTPSKYAKRTWSMLFVSLLTIFSVRHFVSKHKHPHKFYNKKPNSQDNNSTPNSTSRQQAPRKSDYTNHFFPYIKSPQHLPEPSAINKMTLKQAIKLFNQFALVNADNLQAISSSSKINAIKKSFREKSRYLHPDKAGKENMGNFMTMKNAYDRIITLYPNRPNQNSRNNRSF